MTDAAGRAPPDPAAPRRFDPAELTEDDFLGGRVRLRQPRLGYRSGPDAVLLAAACPASQGESALDLGCGAGAAALCLAARVPGVTLHGLELQPAYAALAAENGASVGLVVYEGDARNPPPALRARNFDHVLTNPPWFPAAGSASVDAGRATARRAGATTAEWIDAALRRLKPRGRLTLIHRAGLLDEILAALHGRAGDVTLLPLASREGRAAGRVILTARKGARGPLSLRAPLALHDGPCHVKDGDDFSPRAAALLRDAARLDLDR